MHADEGVNADKLGTLLEQGRYEYSSVEFHGPTLYYATLAFARLHGIENYREGQRGGVAPPCRQRSASLLVARISG